MNYVFVYSLSRCDEEILLWLKFNMISRLVLQFDFDDCRNSNLYLRRNSKVQFVSEQLREHVLIEDSGIFFNFFQDCNSCFDKLLS